MPHIVKKTYLFSYIALCLSAPLIFIFSDFEVTASNENYREDFSSTVTTTLISSVVGDTFCTCDEVTFTAYPTGANNYSFYINGILKQGPSSLNTFIPTGALFNEDQITVTLEKNNDIGIDLVTIFENKIEDPGKIYFKDESDGLEELTVCYGSDSVNLESYRAASVNGILLASFDTRYQWMSSSDKVNWFAIIGANQANYTPPKLTATTFFRRDVISDLNGTVCRSQSNILKMEVEVELMGGTISPNVFTSNNDGINDRYRIIFSGFESLSFSVFDNHGNLLYNEKVSEPNRNSPKGLELEGWDGNDGSSETPYFIYSIEGVLLSDSETKIERSGVFSMLR